MVDKTDKSTRTDSETVIAGTRRETRDNHDACLVIIRGPRLGSRIVLGRKPVVIGRSIDSDFQISERSISRQHCRIIAEGDRYWIEDLGSTNQTYLNEDVVERSALRDGDHIRISQTVLKFVDEGNIEAGYHSELHESTIRDALTGLYNRRHAMALLKTEVAKAEREPDRELTVMILDLDFFKEINDEYGHLAGDGVLRKVAEIARDRVRASDTFARIGGEEFAVILPDTNIADAHRIAESIRKAIEMETFNVGGEVRKVTLSGGIASWSSAFEDMSDLLREADRRLYQAKSSGRNQIC
ncbi:diguanylate cyclase [Wenzhouxiangella sp. AB-CW3]|uniref:diguanylate cyclase n=1 Tax=Wenzhouxiangella sp. AB-CW3 TaxID=2771012 RepID=UPI00168B928B|nr:GGDEF domain-containing protein [Wenzhouxiangella sp. AB-CW3]QOC23286.1 diguanylate cyclase [Wenzhouxiangella sp. AB-CW3]